MKILGKIDPNQPEVVLRFGFKIRSEISHRGQGWDSNRVDEPLEVDLYQDEPSRKCDCLNLQKLSGNLLNYLRISIICRIISELPDRDFIDMLDSKSGEMELDGIFQV